MLISVIHPTARPRQLARVIRKWFDNAAKPARIEYIVAFHQEQFEDFRDYIAVEPGERKIRFVVNKGPDHPTLNGRSSFVGNANLAASCVAGASALLCLATDDLEPPPLWDEDLLRVLVPAYRQTVLYSRPLAEACRSHWEAVVHCSNGTPAADARPLILHPIMTRRRYNRQSWFFCPDYSGMYSDNDLTARAARDGIIIDARGRLNFKHTHPLFGTAETDQIYAWQNAPMEYERGKEIYERRQAAGFPIGPHWQEICDMTERARKLAAPEAPGNE